MRRHILMLSAFLAPAALIACGSSSGNSGGAGGGTGGGTTSSTTTTTSSSGTTTTTSSSSSTTTSSSGTGGAAGGFCTNAADSMVLQTQDVPGIAATCGKNNITTQDKVQQCIVDATKGDSGSGLSSDCAGCFADTVKCTISKCLTQCISDSSSAACVTCRAQNCDPAFYACSGLPQSQGDAGSP